jgi:hypothetical protein
MRHRGLRGLLFVLMVVGGAPVPRGVLAASLSVITVPQSDAEAAGVQIDQAHVFIVATGDRLQVAEYYLIGNSGQSDYVGYSKGEGGERTTVAFEVPADATNLSFDGPGVGERFVGDGQRFEDTQPIPPGSATVEIGFSYELPMREEVQLTRSLDVRVAATVLIVSGQGVGLSGPDLAYNGDMETRMGAAASYVAGALEAGIPLTVRVVAREATGAAAPMVGAVGAPVRLRERNVIGELVVGALSLGLVGLVVAWAWSSRPTRSMPESARPAVEAIVALDGRYEQGQVEPDVYRREREALVRDAVRYAKGEQ